jgi:hypothetical protein
MRTFDNLADAVPVAQAIPGLSEPLPPADVAPCDGCNDSEPACEMFPPGADGAPPDGFDNPPSFVLLPQPVRTPAADKPSKIPAKAFMTSLIVVADSRQHQAMAASIDIDSSGLASRNSAV